MVILPLALWKNPRARNPCIVIAPLYQLMNAVIIDDEPHAVAVLEKLLFIHCPGVVVLGKANNVEQGIRLINRTEPDLIFLDVVMPRASGFKLIKQLPAQQSPEIIFVTSFDAYALEAIRCCALAYIIKPIQTEELLQAVRLANQRIGQKVSYERSQALIHNLNSAQPKHKRLGIPSEKGLEFVEVGHIIRCEGLSGCTRIVLKDGKNLLSSYNIGEFKKLLESYRFFPVHKSHLINLDEIMRYDREGSVLMIDQTLVPVSRRRRQEFLTQIERL